MKNVNTLSIFFTYIVVAISKRNYEKEETWPNIECKNVLKLQNLRVFSGDIFRK